MTQQTNIQIVELRKDALSKGDIVFHNDGYIGEITDTNYNDANEVEVNWINTDAKAMRTSIVYLRAACRRKVAPKEQTNIPTADELWRKYALHIDSEDQLMFPTEFDNAITELRKAYDQRIADLEAKIAELEGTVGSNEYRPWEVKGITQIAWWKKLHLESSKRIADLKQQVAERDERMKQMVGKLKGLRKYSVGFDTAVNVSSSADIQAIIAEFEK